MTVSNTTLRVINGNCKWNGNTGWQRTIFMVSNTKQPNSILVTTAGGYTVYISATLATISTTATTKTTNQSLCVCVCVFRSRCIRKKNGNQ